MKFQCHLKCSGITFLSFLFFLFVFWTYTYCYTCIFSPSLLTYSLSLYIVLVDPAHPDQYTRLPRDFTGALQYISPLFFKAYRLLAPLGVVRLLGLSFPPTSLYTKVWHTRTHTPARARTYTHPLSVCVCKRTYTVFFVRAYRLFAPLGVVRLLGLSFPPHKFTQSYDTHAHMHARTHTYKHTSLVSVHVRVHTHSFVC